MEEWKGQGSVNNSIILTQELSTCYSRSNSPVGRVLHSFPIRFLRSSSNSTVSFSTRFTFTVITPIPPCLAGDGIAFLIASDPNSLPHIDGYLGLPDSPASHPFFAIEFDTTFNPGVGDINDNHVGIDMDSIISVASIDLLSEGIDLKSGIPGWRLHGSFGFGVILGCFWIYRVGRISFLIIRCFPIISSDDEFELVLKKRSADSGSGSGVSWA
ncbi:hypothetical protein L1887_12544 [Cichorium endivia]|nr:hypothetical protein L1887_12544 [Cichorium endivia]